MIESEAVNKTIEQDKNIVLDLKEKLRPYICPYEEILHEIGENKSIYDIGCGQGGLLSLCADKLHPTKLAGIEIDEELIQRAQRKFRNTEVPISLKVFDGVNIPNEISDYDVITMIDVLHHIPQSQQFPFLDQLISKMGKDSKLLIKDIDAKDPLVTFNKLHDLLVSRQISHEINWKDLEEYLKSKGMEIESSFKKRVAVYPHFFLTAKK